MDIPTFNGTFIYFTGHYLEINDCQFASGYALYGGAIYVQDLTSDGLTVIIQNSQFDDNSADLSGGAVMIDQLNLHSIEISDSNFTDNRANIYGDNIYLMQTAYDDDLTSRRL